MRRIVPAAIAAATLLAAAPALALTVVPSPNRDQAPHLKQTRGPGGAIDLRDTLAGGGRPLAGAEFSGSPGDDRRTQTYSFGNVTTTITTGRDDYLPSFIDRDPRSPHDRFDRSRFGSELIGRRR